MGVSGQQWVYSSSETLLYFIQGISTIKYKVIKKGYRNYSNCYPACSMHIWHLLIIATKYFGKAAFRTSCIMLTKITGSTSIYPRTTGWENTVQNGHTRKNFRAKILFDFLNGNTVSSFSIYHVKWFQQLQKLILELAVYCSYAIRKPSSSILSKNIIHCNTHLRKPHDI
jgi:hypothetical protein